MIQSRLRSCYFRFARHKLLFMNLLLVWVASLRAYYFVCHSAVVFSKRFSRVGTFIKTRVTYIPNLQIRVCGSGMVKKKQVSRLVVDNQPQYPEVARVLLSRLCDKVRSTLGHVVLSD